MEPNHRHTHPASDSSGITVTVEGPNLRAVIRGCLTAASVQTSAGRILEPIKHLRPRDIVIDGTDMTYCDGAGIGLISEVRRNSAHGGAVVRLSGFSRDVNTLL